MAYIDDFVPDYLSVETIEAMFVSRRRAPDNTSNDIQVDPSSRIRGEPSEHENSLPTLHRNAAAANAAARPSFLLQSNILLTNPLSVLWKFQLLKEEPGALISGIILWPIGMIGYALSLPLRIGIFVGVLIRTIRDMCNAYQLGTEEFKKVSKARLLILGGATGELVSAIVGCAAPPIAYKIDEAIQSNYEIHRFYRSHYLSFWSQEEKVKEAHYKKAFKEFIKCCDQTKTHLKNYHSNDYIDTPMPRVLDEIFALGILRAYINSSALEKLEKVALYKCGYQAEQEENDKIKAELGGSFSPTEENKARVKKAGQNKQSEMADTISENKSSLKKAYEILQKKHSDQEIIEFVTLKWILDNEPTREEEGYFKDNESKSSFSSAVDALADDEQKAIHAIMTALNSYAATLKSYDRQLEGTLMSDLYSPT